MSEETKIEWATASWNPWIGCTKVSPGCKNCYAEMSTPTRVHRANGRELWGKGSTRQRTSAATWRNPVKWNRDGLICNQCAAGVMNAENLASKHCRKCNSGQLYRPRVFPSLCDWLDDEVPIEWLADFLKLIHDTPNLDWLLLTKRPENFAKLFDTLRRLSYTPNREWVDRWFNGDFPNNVWIGTSVEDQTRADQRIPELLRIPARVRFLSVEPMLGPVDLGLTEYRGPQPANAGHVDWVIVGGESGPGARPCNVEWVRSIVAQCKAAGVACFVKQLGAVANFPHPAPPTGMAFGQEREIDDWVMKFGHPKGGDPAEWPEDLRVREFPRL